MGEVEVLVGGLRYAVFVTHLSLGRRSRDVQIPHIAKTIGGRPHGVLMGDFNTADLTELRPLIDAGWTRAPLGPAHPSWRPSGAIDHVLVGPELVVDRARVVTEVMASDHLPVIVDVTAKET